MSTTLVVVNGDVMVSSATGRPQTISDGPKLSQDVLLNLETDTRPNGFGAGISSLLGAVDDDDLVSVLLDHRLRDSFAAMKILQLAPPRDTRPAAERLASVRPAVVARDNQDPRTFNYQVDVITESGAVLRAAGTVGRE